MYILHRRGLRAARKSTGSNSNVESFMRILLLTTRPHWNSWDEKLAACRGAIGCVQNAGPVAIDIRLYTPEQPPVVDGRISRSWFNMLTKWAHHDGYHALVFHFTEEEARTWGVRSSLRGSCINDEDMGEMWLAANEHSVVRYKSGRTVNRFVKTFTHEMSHWLAARTGAEDRTHYFDYEREHVLGALLTYRLSPSFTQIIMNALRTERLNTPLADWREALVSQRFGNADNLYESGIHAGTDFAVPVGTPLIAPADGIAPITWSKHRTIGNGCTFEFYYNGRLYTMRALHLQATPAKRGYRRGEVIGYTGNTGKSTGPHLHLELWRGGYDPDVLSSAASVRATLIDPWVFFTSLKTS